MHRILLLLVLLLCLWLQDQRSARDPGSDVPVASYSASNEIPKAGTDPLESILRDDPLRFFAMSLEKYDKEVKGYSLTFYNREKIKGKMQAAEKREVYFRDKPHSVYMSWIE